MNNYEYILASVQDPDITPGDFDADAEIAVIKSLLEGRDLKEFSLFEEYMEDGGPCAEFYRKAAKSRCAFIREWFEYDRKVRNTKVAWLNSRLERPVMTDIVLLDDNEELQMSEEALAALRLEDTVEKEKALDKVMWDKAAVLVEMKDFSLDLIMSYAVRFKITDRWMKLDAGTGRAMLRKLTDEIKNSKSIYD